MRKLIVCVLILAAAGLLAEETAVFSVLKSMTPLGKQAAGTYLLPTNQLLRPWGEQTTIPGRPVDMTFDGEKRILAVLNTRSLLLLDGSFAVVLLHRDPSYMETAGEAARSLIEAALPRRKAKTSLRGA